MTELAMAALPDELWAAGCGCGGSDGWGPWGGCGGWTDWDVWGPYGKGWFKGFGGKGGKGWFKGKGKGRGKPHKPLFDSEGRPIVNSSHINPSKDPLDGGINFKTLLQEQVVKALHRPIAQGDIHYSSTRVRDGRHGALVIPCLGAGEDGSERRWETDVPSSDEKKAGQVCASKAMEELFPELFLAALEAHGARALAAAANAQALAAAAEAGLDLAATMGVSAEDLGALASVDAATTSGAASSVSCGEDPKSMLNTRLQLALGRPVAAGDIVYKTDWNYMNNTYECNLKIVGLSDVETVYVSDIPNCMDKKAAERDAARKALEANVEHFEAAVAKREQEKVEKQARSKTGKGKTWGSGRDGGLGGGKRGRSSLSPPPRDRRGSPRRGFMSSGAPAPAFERAPPFPLPGGCGYSAGPGYGPYMPHPGHYGYPAGHVQPSSVYGYLGYGPSKTA